MGSNTANIYIQNQTGGNAIITLSHMYGSNNAEVGGPWQAAPNQTVGPLVVNFNTGPWPSDWGLDFWWVNAIVLDGPNKGNYVSEGTEFFPGKECMLESADAGQNITCAVSNTTFYINLDSGKCTTTMSQVPMPPQYAIQHVFVLALENRAFDHMLGFANITGKDAVNGETVTVNAPAESNSYNGTSYPLTSGAAANMQFDPGHEFPDVVEQLCGEGATYTPNSDYPSIDNSGFVVNYATTKSAQEGASSNYAQIMQCYTAGDLPILTALANNFVLCTNWFSSLPGPTWPNRFFMHAASSGGLDTSPTETQMGTWEVAGFSFQNGTIFDAVRNQGGLGGWRIYNGQNTGLPTSGGIPISAAIKNISYTDTTDFSEFQADLAGLNGPYTATYTFIEPNYGDVGNGTYVGGNSQHPIDSVVSGEALIKTVYETLRASSIWESSLLIITYDEHGGFYDHVAPPAATPPGDSPENGDVSVYGFNFKQYGVRVPAVIVSPYVGQNIIDQRTYDHSSIPATVEALFGLGHLTNRDKGANNLTPLLNLSAQPRTDCPVTLPAVNNNFPPPPAPADSTTLDAEPIPTTGNYQGFMQIMYKTDLEVSPPATHPAITAEYKSLQTKGDAKAYIAKVQGKVQAAKAAQAAAKISDPYMGRPDNSNKVSN